MQDTCIYEVPSEDVFPTADVLVLADVIAKDCS